MKTLIVDNGTKHLSRLKKLISNSSLEVVSYSEIDTVDPKKFNAVILSGGHNFPVYGNESQLQKEIDFIKNSEAKILGICFGFELIAQTFGAKLELMEERERGILDIQVLENSEIFADVPNLRVFESHRWVVKEPIGDLIALARSKDGIEAIRHKSRPIYAVQFHPEMFLDKTCGDEIFFNFLNMAS